MNIKKIKEDIENNSNSKWLEFFSRKSVGIDIADRSIEVVELERSGKTFKTNYGRTELPAGVVKGGKIIDENKLSQALKLTLENAKPNRIETTKAVFGLPESQVYYHVFSVAKQLAGEDLARTVGREAESTLPIVFSDQVFSYKIVEKELSNKEVATKEILLLATSKSLIEGWISFFKKNKISVVILDFEPIASYRALLKEKSKTPVCIVDIGSEQSIYSVINCNNLYYSFSYAYAGVAITKQLMADINTGETKVSFEEAEKLKIENGLNVTSAYGKPLRQALEPIVKEIKNALAVGGQASSTTIKNVVLTGGSASLPGLAAHISTVINNGVEQGADKYVEVEIGEIKKLGSGKLDVKYSQAVGLALRVLDGGLSDVLDINEKFRISKKKVAPVPVDVVGNIPESRGEIRVATVGASSLERQKRLLLLILVIGVISVAGSFWLKSKRQTDSRDSRYGATKQSNVKHPNTTQLEVLVSTATSTATTTVVRGVLFNDIQKEPTTYLDVVQKSKKIITTKISNEYILWNEPVKLSSQAKSLIFPLTITWLELKRDDLERVVVNKVRNKYPGQSLQVSNILIKALNKTQESHLFSALVTLNLSQ